MPQAIHPSPSPAIFLDPALQGDIKDPNIAGTTRESSAEGNNIAFNEMQNPSDALGILAQIASNGGEHTFTSSRQSTVQPTTNQLDYPLVTEGKLGLSRIINLLQRYKHYYHPYFPIVPPATLDAGNLTRTAREERHLLTAVLVVASRDLTEEPQIFGACSEYMRTLVSSLAAGGPGNVEAVEALLLLAEWTPYTSRSDAGHVGRGEEDREAWMHVGTALRIGYFLGLDRYSFAVRGDDVKDPQWQRKRLVWTACYISDRQISIRLGRAFWSRGPGPLTTLRKEDFPMLTPAGSGEEDFASIFQATLELTLLFSNVHDVLYSNPGNSMRSHLSGGYIKYIDDFLSAIYGWKSVWGTLTCSPNLKATLLMSYDYLRLYTNAFAFHATVKRAVAQDPAPDASANTKSKRGPSVQRVFYSKFDGPHSIASPYADLPQTTLELLAMRASSTRDLTRPKVCSACAILSLTPNELSDICLCDSTSTASTALFSCIAHAAPASCLPTRSSRSVRWYKRPSRVSNALVSVPIIPVPATRNFSGSCGTRSIGKNAKHRLVRQRSRILTVRAQLVGPQHPLGLLAPMHL